MTERFSEEETRKEIEEGIAEFLNSKNPEKEIDPETTASFETTTTEDPLKRQAFESDVENFVGQNFKEWVPLLASEPQQARGELIKRLKLTNEQIGLLGANYFIKENDGSMNLYQTDEDYPDGRIVSYETIDGGDLLALAYVRDAVRIDTARDVGKSKKSTPHRYYLNSQGRYLCSNDFGMRVWDEEKKEMADGDVTNLASFVKTAKRELERIQKNIETVGIEKASENETNKALVLHAISRGSMERDFVFKAGEIARKAGITDYTNIDLGRIFAPPTEEEQAGATIQFTRFLPFDKLVLSAEDKGQFDRGSEFFKTRIREALVRKEIEGGGRCLA